MTRPAHGDSTRARPFVKVCGVTRNEDAIQIQSAGADYIGVVVSRGFGRSVPAGAVAGVLEGVTIPRVAVTVDESAVGNASLARGVGASVLQLHGQEKAATVRTLRELGDWAIWKAVRARSVDDVHRAIDELGGLIDGVLIEGWRPDAVGGAGLVLDLDPELVRGAVPKGVSFVLAGGLTPETVGPSATRFSPDVVDVSSGVEREPGIKDPERVEAFIRAARSATVLGRSDPHPREP